MNIFHAHTANVLFEKDNYNKKRKVISLKVLLVIQRICNLLKSYMIIRIISYKKLYAYNVEHL